MIMWMKIPDIATLATFGLCLAAYSIRTITGQTLSLEPTENETAESSTDQMHFLW